MAQDFQQLTVWQRAVELTVCIYTLTRSFPKEEVYGLTSQMRRASISIASNIAEGRGRLSRAEFRHFRGIAQGSNFELRTQLEVARRLRLTSASSANEAQLLCEEVSKMLTSFIQKLTNEAEKLLTAES